MSEATNYSVVERLRNGRAIEVRALRPSDRADLVAAANSIGARSLYCRFLGLKRHFSEKEIDFFVNIDFADHVAIVVVIREGGRRAIVGGGRYVVVRPGTAEVAFTVVDKYQGQGIGAVLMRHVVTLAGKAGLEELIAEVLPDNVPMLKVFERSGLCLRRWQEDGVVHVSMRIS